MSQVATASERPPHLKAIAPGMALTDPRLDSWEIGGVPSQGFVTGWWMFLHSRWLAVRRSAEKENDQQCLTQVEKNYEQGEKADINLPGLLVRHPLRDEWVNARTILVKADRIAVPVLHGNDSIVGCMRFCRLRRQTAPAMNLEGIREWKLNVSACQDQSS